MKESECEGLEMDRYSRITKKFPREIVLLKGSPCRWGKCSFCDYIEDNSIDQEANSKINKEVLNQVTGEFGVLEVINSGNFFELPKATVEDIKGIIKTKAIGEIFVEAHWIYRKKLEQLRLDLGIPVRVKTGLESFNREFRETILLKGFNYKDINELKENFDSVCLMVGIEGQTKEMIDEDIRLAMKHFDHFTVNIFVENTTEIKADMALQEWFAKAYLWLEEEPKCEVLWVNTDFGVGE